MRTGFVNLKSGDTWSRYMSPTEALRGTCAGSSICTAGPASPPPGTSSNAT